jgi:hypothetical protein
VGKEQKMIFKGLTNFKSGLKGDSRNYFIALSFLLSFGLLMNTLKSGKEFFINPGPLIPFFIGVITWILFWHIRLRNKPRTFFQTFHHECGHFVLAEALGAKVNDFRASEESYDLEGNTFKGHVGYSSPRLFKNRNNKFIIITLGVYFVPFLLIPLLIVRMFIADPYLPLIDIIIGITYGFYAFEYTLETKKMYNTEKSVEKNKGYDLHKYGVAFAVACIILGNLILMPAIVLVLYQGWLSAALHCISGFTFWIDLII